MYNETKKVEFDEPNSISEKSVESKTLVCPNSSGVTLTM